MELLGVKQGLIIYLGQLSQDKTIIKHKEHSIMHWVSVAAKSIIRYSIYPRNYYSTVEKDTEAEKRSDSSKTTI